MVKAKGKTKVKAFVKDSETGKKKELKSLSKALEKKINEPVNDIGTHLSHCNQGEHVGTCKYGENDTCPALKENFGGEVVCIMCGNIATKRKEFCVHQKDRYGDLKEPILSVNDRQPELAGMPPKTEATIIAEDILDLRDKIASQREALDMLKSKLIGEMRLHQQSHMLIKGWNFDVSLEDKLKVTKKK